MRKKRLFIPGLAMPAMSKIHTYSDTFDRADGAIGGRFTGSTWTILSNKAVNTPVPSVTNKIVNGTFATDSDWTGRAAGGWAIAGGKATHTAGTAGALSEAVLTSNKWYQTAYDVLDYGTGVLNVYSGGSYNGPSRATNDSFVETNLCGTSTAFAFNGGSTWGGAVDNVVCNELVTSELIASIPFALSGGTVSAAVTWTIGYQAGLVLCLDSVTDPKNFILVILNNYGSTRCQVFKCVAGVYSQVKDTAVTYSAGAVLTATKSGTSVTVKYNGSAVGTAATVSDSSIVNNKYHGMFSTGDPTKVSFDDFSFIP